MAHPYGQAACSNQSAPSSNTSSLIRDAVGMTEKLLTDAHEAIQAIEERLETVLTPVPPMASGVGPGDPVGPPSSHVHERLLSLNRGLSAVSNRLRDLIRRVEV